MDCRDLIDSLGPGGSGVLAGRNSQPDSIPHCGFSLGSIAKDSVVVVESIDRRGSWSGKCDGGMLCAPSLEVSDAVSSSR